MVLSALVATQPWLPVFISLWTKTTSPRPAPSPPYTAAARPCPAGEGTDGAPACQPHRRQPQFKQRSDWPPHLTTGFLWPPGVCQDVLLCQAWSGPGLWGQTWALH